MTRRTFQIVFLGLLATMLPSRRAPAAERMVKTGQAGTADPTLNDLKKAASESASSLEGKCGEYKLLDSTDKAVRKLAGIAPGVKSAGEPNGEHKAAKKGKAGIEWIFSRPAGIFFTKTEVTVAQYRVCVKAGRCTEPLSNSRYSLCNWGHVGRDNHPVNCVSWNQAKAFCKWAGGRLPTEDEWYAEASNGGKRVYPWGDQKPTCRYAIMIRDDGRDGCGRYSTWPVCSKTWGNSVSGLCDMAGNVGEWTSSVDDKEHDRRAFRGGAWNDGVPVSLRVSRRNWVSPARGSSGRGIRCVRSSR